ncbi:MAG: hypothetical protein JO153_07910 [Solirubrobacterales bacterium]|nr:hypothetical protein [Solirubrobacterales bacterium]
MTTEGLGVARSLAGRHRYSIAANRELIAVGAGNLLAGPSRASCRPAGRARLPRPTKPAAGPSSRRSSQPG